MQRQIFVDFDESSEAFFIKVSPITLVIEIIPFLYRARVKGSGLIQCKYLDIGMLKSLFYITPEVFLSEKVYEIFGISEKELLEDILFEQDIEAYKDVIIDFSEFTNLSLYPHQELAIRRAYKQMGFGLFFDMRCGKTITSLILASLWHKEGLIDRVLVVAPFSAIDSWKRDIDKHLLYNIRYFYIKDRRPKSILRTLSTFPKTKKLFLLLVNYEFCRTKIFKDFMDEFLYDNRFLVIFDESHRLKNRKTKTFKLYKSIANKARKTLILSGTPVSKSIEDIWTQAFVIKASHLLGTTYWKFVKKYLFKPNPNWFGFIERKGSREEVFNLLAKKSLSVKQEEVFPHQEVFKEQIKFELNAKQREYYEMIKHNIIVKFDAGLLTVNTGLVEALKLLQVISGWVYLDSGEKVSFDSQKNQILRDLLADLEGQKVVIWTIFNDEADMLYILCKDMKRKPIIIDGRTKVEKREELLEGFFSDEYDTLITKPSVLSLGADLSISRVAIYYSRNFSYVERSQSLSRLINPNVKGALTIYDLVAQNTIDEYVLKVLNKNEDLAKSLHKASSFKNFLQGGLV